MDYSHPRTHGYPSWVPDPSARDQHDPRIDECGNIHNRVIHTLSILSDTPTTSIPKHDQQPSTTTSIQKNDQQPSTIDYNKFKPYFGWVNAETIDRIPSTTPGAEPPRDAKNPGSARSHSMHLETSSSNRP